MRRQAVLLALAGLSVTASCGTRSNLLPMGEPDPGKLVADAGHDEAHDAAGTDAWAVDADADAPTACVPGDDWLTDPCLWEQVKGLEACDVYQARLPSPTYPQRQWESCGAGCKSTRAPLGSMPLASMGRGWSDGDSTWVRLVWNSEYNVGPIVTEILDVTHNRPAMALETRNFLYQGYAQCLDDWGDLGPVRVESWIWWDGEPNQVSADTERRYLAVSRYRTSASLEPMDGYIDTTYDWPEYTSFVATDTHWGTTEGHKHAKLRVKKGSGGKPSLSPVAPPNPVDFADNLMTYDDTFYWSETDFGPSQVHSWAPGEGYGLLASRPNYITALWVGDTGLAWTESTATWPDPETVNLSDASLWWMPSTAAGSPVPVASGLGVAGIAMVTGGDLAAVLMAAPDDCRLVLARLSTGQVWRLGHPSATTHWSVPSHIDARELLIGETDEPCYTPHSLSAQRIYILDVSDPDALLALFPE